MTKAVIGLDLSGRSWKSVVVSRSGKDRLRIHDHFSLPPPPLPPWRFLPDHDNDAQLESRLEDWLSRINGSIHSFSRKSLAVVGLPQELVSLRLVDLPFLQRPKLAQALPLEAEGVLPFDLEDLIFDFFPVHQFNGHTRVFSASALRNHLGGTLSLLGRLSLDPAVITVTALSYHHLLRCLGPSGAPGLSRLGFLHLGDRSIQLSVVEGDRTVFARTFNFGIFPPEPPLGPDSDPDAPVPEPSEAEVAVHRSRLPELLVRVLDRTAHFLEGHNPLGSGCPPPLSRIVLVGECGVLPELPDKLEQSLGVSCEFFRVFDDMISEDSPLRDDLHPSLAPALALALPRALTGARETINFRQQEFAFRPERQAVIRKAIMPGLLAVIWILTMILGRVDIGNPDQEQARLIRQEMREAFRAQVGEPPPAPELRMKELLEAAKIKQLKYQDLTYPSALDSLAAISSSVPEALNVTVTNFQYQGSRISFTATADRTEQATELARQLENVPFFSRVSLERIQQQSGGAAAEGSSFNINIDLKRDSLK